MSGHNKVSMPGLPKVKTSNSLFVPIKEGDYYLLDMDTKADSKLQFRQWGMAQPDTPNFGDRVELKADGTEHEAAKIDGFVTMYLSYSGYTEGRSSMATMHIGEDLSKPEATGKCSVSYFDQRYPYATCTLPIRKGQKVKADLENFMGSDATLKMSFVPVVNSVVKIKAPESRTVDIEYTAESDGFLTVLLNLKSNFPIGNTPVVTATLFCDQGAKLEKVASTFVKAGRLSNSGNTITMPVTKGTKYRIETDAKDGSYETSVESNWYPYEAVEV